MVDGTGCREGSWDTADLLPACSGHCMRMGHAPRGVLGSGPRPFLRLSNTERGDGPHLVCAFVCRGRWVVSPWATLVRFGWGRRDHLRCWMSRLEGC